MISDEEHKKLEELFEEDYVPIENRPIEEQQKFFDWLFDKDEQEEFEKFLNNLSKTKEENKDENITKDSQLSNR